MTPETVHPHRNLNMATLTELTLVVDRDVLPARRSGGVAGNTADQAVSGFPFSGIHGPVTLMEQKIHMVPAHGFRRFHALAELRCPAVLRDPGR